MFLAGLGVTIFSLSLPLTKIAIRGLDPVFVALSRGAVGGLLSCMILLVWRIERPSAYELRQLLVIIGGALIGFPLLTTFALRHTASNHGVIVIGLLPLATAGCAVVRTGERTTRRYWCSAVVGLGAVLAYAIDKNGGSLRLADLLLALAVVVVAFSYTEGALMARSRPSWQVTCLTLVVGLPVTLPLSLYALSGDRTATIGQWAACLYIGVFSVLLGLFAWYKGLADAGIARAAQLQLLQPILSLAWAWPLLGERLDAAAVLTAIIVVASVAVGALGPNAARAASNLPPIELPAAP